MAHVSRNPIVAKEQQTMNESPRFHHFAGRYREEARLAPILKSVVGPVLGSVFPNWFDYLMKTYASRVPYHNRIHVSYGLLWLVSQKAPVDVILAWLGHDSWHNGNAKLSPETASADALRDAIGHDNLRAIILHTVFPYVSGFDGAPDKWPQKPAETLEGGLIRLADTYRQYTGLTPNLNVEGATVMDVYLMEGIGLSHELYEVDGTTTFPQWIINGQAGFFPTQIDLGIDADVFGKIDAEEAHAAVNRVRSWLKAVIADEAKFAALRQLHQFWMQDVTLPEFVAKRIELVL